MKRLIYSLIIVLTIVGCNQKKETLLKQGDINGSLVQVWKFPIRDSSRYQSLFLNPINKKNTPVLDSIKVYGQVGREYRHLGSFKITGTEPAHSVSLEYSNDTIYYVSYTKNAYNNTYETFSFKWESDSLSVLDHNNIQVPANKFNKEDSLALLDMYKSAGGENWLNKWDLKMPISTWYGVNIKKRDRLDLCNHRVAYYVVQSLVLPFNNLKGSIPEEVFKLKYLDVEASQFVGNELNTKVVLPDYKDETNLEITLEYFENDSIVFDDYQAMVLFKEGAKVYAIDKDGNRGEELGKIVGKEKVQTINPFVHTPQEGGMGLAVKFGYEGEYIPIKYNRSYGIDFFRVFIRYSFVYIS